MLARDDYAYYRSVLAGQPLPLVVGKVECGFYRKRDRDGSIVGVAIWRQDGQLVCKYARGRAFPIERPEEFAHDRFAWFCEDVVTEDAYFAWLEDGTPWPDQAPPPAVSKSNLPDDPFEALKVQIEAEVEQLNAALSGSLNAVNDQTQADRLSNWKARFHELAREADNLRKREKGVHDAAARAVQEKFIPIITKAEDAKRKIASVVEGYLKQQKAQARQQIAETVASGAKADRPKAAGTVGVKTKLVTVRKASVSSYSDLATWLLAAKNPELLECLDSIANKIARAGGEAPGTIVTEVQVAR